VAVSFYSIITLIAVVFGLSEDWILYQPACSFRAYCVLVLCAVVCYSISLQAISRLFYAVFYKYRYLLTWRTHWILIILNWFISIMVSIEPFFINDGFALVTEIRICTVSPKVFKASMYAIVIIYIISLHIVEIAYSVILYHVRQSTRRVTAFVPTVNTGNITNANKAAFNIKRDLKLIRNILIQTNILVLGGTPYLILVIWNAIQRQSPPESLYFLSINSIAICNVLMVIYTFFMNKNIRNTALKYFCRHRPVIIVGRRIQLQRMRQNIKY
jgi:hypothetical protein